MQETGRKRGREVYGRREKRGREAGEKGKIMQHCKYFGIEKMQRVGANKYMAGTGLKGLESGRFKPPCPLNFKVLLPLDGMGKRGEGVYPKNFK